MVLLLLKKRTLFSKIPAVSAHESKSGSCSSELSLQALQFPRQLFSIYWHNFSQQHLLAMANISVWSVKISRAEILTIFPLLFWKIDRLHKFILTLTDLQYSLELHYLQYKRMNLNKLYIHITYVLLESTRISCQSM